MTLEAMQEHESVTLLYGPTDYRRVALVDLLESLVTGRCILDMRCLNGELLARLSSRGAIRGLDGYEDAVKSCNTLMSKLGINTKVSFLWNLIDVPSAVSEMSYDSVICADLLNHVPDDRLALRQIHKLLSPQGQLLLVIPAFSSLEGERDRSLGHLRRYSVRQISELLSEAGFEIRSYRYWNFLAFFPYVLLEKILRMPLRDSVRYSGADPKDTITGPLLRWWYRNVENRFRFPFGLSLVIDATKLT